MVVVKAADKTDLQLDAGLLDSLERLVNLIEVGVDRLLAENMLAGLGRAHDELRMGVRGGTDEYRLDRGIAEDHLRILIALLDAHVRRPGAGRVVHERIGNRVKLSFRYSMRQIFTMQLTNAAGTQQTNTNLFHLHTLSFVIS